MIVVWFSEIIVVLFLGVVFVVSYVLGFLRVFLVFFRVFWSGFGF